MAAWRWYKMHCSWFFTLKERLLKSISISNISYLSYQKIPETTISSLLVQDVSKRIHSYIYLVHYSQLGRRNVFSFWERMLESARVERMSVYFMPVWRYFWWCVRLCVLCVCVSLCLSGCDGFICYAKQYILL